MHIDHVNRTVRLPDGSDFRVGSRILAAQSGDGWFAVRFDAGDGYETEQARVLATRVISWTTQTLPGVRVVVDPSRTFAEFPHGVARFSTPLRVLVQADDVFIAAVTAESGDTRNVYGYDFAGRQIWRIADISGVLRKGPYVAVDRSPRREYRGLNNNAYASTIDPHTGQVIEVVNGPW
jgi:hypothetical protein